MRVFPLFPELDYCRARAALILRRLCNRRNMWVLLQHLPDRLA